MKTSHDLPTRDSAGRWPLWAVLSIAFLGSVGTGVFTNGIFFMTKHAYGFSVVQNYWLGLVLGLTYSVAALAAGPLLSRLARRKLATRTVLFWNLLAMAVVCLVPIAVREAGFHEHRWPIWLLILVYSPLTGMHWPLIESFLSGGRTGASLRSAVGRFNIVWSSALVVGMWGVGPLIEDAAMAIGLLGIVHLLTIPMLRYLRPDPGRHLDDAHEPHPPIYNQLLVVFRFLLPTSYIVSTALTPFLPAALTRLEVSSHWQTPMAATWMAARFGTFVLLERWHGWHGRWYPAVGGVGFLLSGFALAVLAPQLGTVAGISAILLGLAAFGIGMATIYSGALYYAMEVGRAEVQAGGIHEALIGIGYTVGPLCGLAAAGSVAAGVVAEGRFDAAMLSLVSVIAGLALLIALRLAWRAARPGTRTQTEM